MQYSHQIDRRFVGPFRVVRCIGEQLYEIDLPKTKKTHNIFHVPLPKLWKESSFVYGSRTDERVPELDDPDDIQHYPVEEILRWRK